MKLCVVPRPVGLLVGIIEEEFVRENGEKQFRITHLGNEGQPEIWVVPASSVQVIEGPASAALQATYNEWVERHLCPLVRHTDLHLASIAATY